MCYEFACLPHVLVSAVRSESTVHSPCEKQKKCRSPRGLMITRIHRLPATAHVFFAPQRQASHHTLVQSLMQQLVVDRLDRQSNSPNHNLLQLINKCFFQVIHLLPNLRADVKTPPDSHQTTILFLKLYTRQNAVCRAATHGNATDHKAIPYTQPRHRTNDSRSQSPGPTTLRAYSLSLFSQYSR